MKCSNLYIIRKWYLFFFSQIDFLYQAGTKLQREFNKQVQNYEMFL